ncbi:MAG: YggS family pyridoxal phosphate-dependent enzyme [Chloroflexi bacterium]|nr:YggS family pyridoxal phosphate-dependent enzyme [Chloroflexota bacterium]
MAEVLSAADIAANVRRVEERIAAACARSGRSAGSVTVVAATKTVTVLAMRAAFDAGIRHFGENRVQEAAEKRAKLSDLGPQVAWHMFGRLQSNKVRRALDIFDSIDSVDSLRLTGLVTRYAATKVPILFAVNMAGEATKAGFSPDQVAAAAAEVDALPNLELLGLMCIPPLGRDPRPFFRRLRRMCDELDLPEASMGMSADFEIAVEEGATTVRIGRALFGERNVR